MYPEILGPLSAKTQKELEVYSLHLTNSLNKPIDKNEPIAFLSSTGKIGDSLVEMVLVNNLIRNGYTVHVYGTFPHMLREWLPHMTIFPAISTDEKEKLEKYQTILMFFSTGTEKELQQWHPNAIAFNHAPLRNFNTSRANLQLIVCHVHLKLTDLVNSPGMTPLPGLVKHRYQNRILIHPTSSAKSKNWPPEKFLALVRELKTRGYEPHFVMTKKEKEEWIPYLGTEFSAPDFASLSNIAAWLYESGYFIGTDSGIGHLASSLGIPTLSIISRKKYATYWRPAWSQSEIITPPDWVNLPWIRELFWKRFVSVEQVLEGFERLAKK